MKSKKNLLIIVSVVLAIFMSSCSTFSEKSSIRKNEMLTFDDVSFDGVVAVEDLKNLGKVEAVRTVTYILQMNGDYTIEMGDFKYTYTKVTGEAVIEGTRVIGNLKVAQTASAEGAMGGISSSLIPDFSGLLGGLLGSEEQTQSEPVSMSPKTIALEAANYDLMAAAAAKGATSLLVPEYSWAIEEEQTGSTMKLFFLPPSKTYETQTLVYTVTARATAVSF